MGVELVSERLETWTQFVVTCARTSFVRVGQSEPMDWFCGGFSTQTR